MTQPISMIAKSLVRERQRTGLSLAEIARRAGIAKSTLSQLEAGNGNPSLETLWSLCVALDIPFARLLEPQEQKTQVIRRGVGLTEAPEELGEGDYICYPADQEHIFKALEPDTQAILVSEQN